LLESNQNTRENYKFTHHQQPLIAPRLIYKLVLAAQTIF